MKQFFTLKQMKRYDCFNSCFTGPASGDCTFERGTCHWNNTAVNDMPWYLREGKTGSVNTGPSVDHTTGTPSGIVYPLVFSS